MQQIHTVSAASAIAGRISASQELPYMTPPIAPPQQHFSGDSQDSSSKFEEIFSLKIEKKNPNFTAELLIYSLIELFRGLHEHQCTRTVG